MKHVSDCLPRVSVLPKSISYMCQQFQDCLHMSRLDRKAIFVVIGDGGAQ